MMTRRKCSKSKLANVELPQNQMTSYLKISYHVDFEIRIALKIPKFCLLVLYRMTIYQKSRCPNIKTYCEIRFNFKSGNFLSSRYKNMKILRCTNLL